MERKYLFEAGLNVFTSYKTLIPVEQLQTLETTDTKKYHLYFILAYPQVFYRSEKTFINENGIHICLFAIIDGIETEFVLPVWNIHPDLDYQKVTMRLQYPNMALTIQIEDIEFCRLHPEFTNFSQTIYSHDLFTTFSEQLIRKQEFEVLYIGQSYGKRGERTAITRLSSHSTLQKILMDCQSKYSDKHIYLLLLEITPLLNMTFDGLSKKYTKSIEESVNVNEFLYHRTF